MKQLLLLALLLGISLNARAAVIIVPDHQASIQAAIEAAQANDAIVVRPGVYTENIDFLGKAIRIRSVLGPAVTTIDGSRTGSVVFFGTGEGPDSVIDGFTITNGQATEGGGVRVSSATPTIRNNVITGNSGTFGGGIYSRGSPTITGNLIEDNTAGSGGGIYCTFYSTAVIADNTIRGNRAGNGGGIYCLQDSRPVIHNNIITGNSSDIGGGGIYLNKNFTETLQNNTIAGNSAYYFGGGLYCNNNSQPVVVNTILWDNSAPEGPEIWIGYNLAPSTLGISHSVVQGGQASVWTDAGCVLNWGQGMLTADPAFAERGVDDYHLTYPSPCRNGGDSSAPGLPLFDFEEDPRIAEGAIDIGADEFHLHLYHTGVVTAGANVDVRLAGIPGTSPLWAAVGFGGMRKTPYPTPSGDLYLLWPIYKFSLGTVPASGIAITTVTIPASWIPGKNYPLQALAGSELTNPIVFEVE
jgi:hypothetical protein